MNMTSHPEIERKYEVNEGAVLPRFDQFAEAGVARVAPPVTFDLEALYFDTADGALAARRITLRRRSGGADAGWHLKLPAAEGRTELGWPLTAGGADGETEVPAEVLEPVRGVVRDHPLAVIARITTRRTITRLLAGDGAELVEIADDTVSASDTVSGILRTWREWEAELLDGAPATSEQRAGLLDAVELALLAAGATPAASASKLATALGRTSLVEKMEPRLLDRRSAASDVLLAPIRALVGGLPDLDAAVRSNQPDSVHRMRTRIRRIRSLLAGYRTVFDRVGAKGLDAQLRHLGAVLGDARDPEVMRQRVAALVDDHPQLPRSLRDALLADFDGTAARERVIAELGSERYFRLLDALDEFVARPALSADATLAAQSVIPTALRKQLKRVLAGAERADAASSEFERTPLLHATRKAAKRLRYMAEAASVGKGAVFGEEVRRIGAAAEWVHNVLGEHRDSVLLQDHLRRAAPSSTLAFYYGVLHEIERHSASLRLTESGDAIRELERLRRS